MCTCTCSCNFYLMLIRHYFILLLIFLINRELHCGNNDITSPGLTYIADAIEQ